MPRQLAVSVGRLVEIPLPARQPLRRWTSSKRVACSCAPHNSAKNSKHAVTGRADVMDAAAVGGLGGTFGGNPLACAAALAALDIIETGGLLLRSTQLGKKFETRGNQWQKQFQIVGEIRGLGGMCAIELVKNPVTREPAGDETKRVAQYCYEHGLITITAGTYGNVMRILVPLIVTDEQFDEGLDVLEAALAHVSAAAPEKQLVTSNL